jgi:hypothetical protein
MEITDADQPNVTIGIFHERLGKMKQINATIAMIRLIWNLEEPIK